MEELNELEEIFEEPVSIAEARTFMLAAVVGAAGAWDIAFDFGAFGTVFYHKIFFIWASSIALFCVSIFLPEERSPVKWWGRVLLILPTLWILLAFAQSTFELPSFDVYLELVAVATIALCFPYALWVVGQITQPEFFTIEKRRLIIALVVIVLSVSAIAYFTGRYHYLLLSCEDFALAGSFVPENCGTPVIGLDF